MNLEEVDLRKVYRTWKSDLGPFQSFFRSSPFVSLQTYDDFELTEEKIIECDKTIINNIIENSDDSSFVIVDLPLKEILDIALILNNEFLIKPVLNINLLFHPFGIIGDKNDISKLINNSLRLKEIKTKKFVMLIPYNRYSDDLDYRNFNDKLNNQYGIGEDDLPYAFMLKELGYIKIVILTKDKIKEDLNVYINSVNKELEVEIIRVMK
ncbi:normocyte-binding protein [Clostridium sp.]|uniref:normocyte-binding protein n=1 Tax=Clostridium sp. TaxID=1506 RepID=UPI002636B4D4|nr:normocyte-binding protein [Clostridium sp.]